MQSALCGRNIHFFLSFFTYPHHSSSTPLHSTTKIKQQKSRERRIKRIKEDNKKSARGVREKWNNKKTKNQEFGLLVVWLFCCPKQWHRYGLENLLFLYQLSNNHIPDFYNHFFLANKKIYSIHSEEKRCRY